MKVTKLLRGWLVSEKHIDSESTSDDEVREVTTKLLMSGDLSGEKFTELTADKDAEPANRIESLLSGLVDTVKAQGEEIKALKDGGNKESGDGGKGEKEAPTTPSYFDKAFADRGNDDSETVVRVRGAHERYDTAKSAAHYPDHLSNGTKHPMAGQQVFEGGLNGRRAVNHPSQLDKAVIGAYSKWAIASQLGGKCPAAMRPTDHDKDLVQYALKELSWGGVIKGDCTTVEGAIGVNNEKLSDFQIKAILDDATSGGLEIAPIVFDDAIIMTPLLFGEFFPRVNVVNLTRGRRVEGGTMGNVTLNSGGADGTAIPLFNTASFIAAFDTNIFVCDGSIEIGLDFLGDSPVPVADRITENYGQVLLSWLDEQICVGDGTTEPEGIMNASGTTSVSHSNAAPTVGGYESLLFGVAKKYKQGFDMNRIVFGGNETTYQRARGIAVGSADARRVFGLNQENYQLFAHPYGINEQMANTQIFFANLARYRMYRRLGLTIRVTTEGKELVRDNMMLIAARARYGGQLEDGGAAAVVTDAQA